MSRFTKSRSIVVLGLLVAALLVSVALAGCGGDEESTTTTAEPPAGETTTTAVATTETTGITPPSGDPIIIGVVGPFSGSAGFLGEWTANSINIMVDQKNAAGGLLGRPLEVQTRDDGLDPAKSVSFTREFADMENIGMIVGPVLTSNFLAAKPVLVEKKIINGLNIVSGTDALVDAPYSFRNLTNTAIQAETILKYVSENLDMKKVGAIEQDDETGHHISDLVPAIAEKYGLEFVGIEFVNPKESDYLNQVKRIKDAGAEMVLLPPVAPTASKVMLAMEQVDWNPQVIGWGMQTATIAASSPDIVDGILFNDSIIWNRLDNVSEDAWPPLYAAHYKDIIAQYGSQDVGGVSQPKGEHGAAELMMEYFMAVEMAGSLDPDAVKAAWESIDLAPEETYFGVPIAYSSSDHEAWDPASAFVYEWKKKADGTFGVELRQPAPSQ